MKAGGRGYETSGLLPSESVAHKSLIGRRIQREFGPDFALVQSSATEPNYHS